MKDKTRQTLELGAAIKAARITLTISDEEAKEILFALDQRGEWIPTIERLPEVGDTVLCSVKTPECTDHHIIICKYCAEEFWKDGTIRAWQPLPEPYKKPEEGETKDWVDKEWVKKYGVVIRETGASK